MLYRLSYKVKDIWLEIKWAWQRVFKGYDERAVWNINTWFLDIMPKLLNDLLDDRCGHPGNMTDKQWEKILTKMKDCFIDANEDTCTVKNKYEKDFERVWDEFEDQYGSFGSLLPGADERTPEGNLRVYTPDCPEINNKEWKKVCDKYLKDNDRLYKYRDKKLHEGLELFNKYFWNLWD